MLRLLEHAQNVASFLRNIETTCIYILVPSRAVKCDFFRRHYMTEKIWHERTCRQCNYSNTNASLKLRGISIPRYYDIIQILNFLVYLRIFVTSRLMIGGNSAFVSITKKKLKTALFCIILIIFSIYMYTFLFVCLKRYTSYTKNDSAVHACVFLEQYVYFLVLPSSTGNPRVFQKLSFLFHRPLWFVFIFENLSCRFIPKWPKKYLLIGETCCKVLK